MKNRIRTVVTLVTISLLFGCKPNVDSSAKVDDQSSGAQRPSARPPSDPSLVQDAAQLESAKNGLIRATSALATTTGGGRDYAEALVKLNEAHSALKNVQSGSRDLTDAIASVKSAVENITKAKNRQGNEQRHLNLGILDLMEATVKVSEILALSKLKSAQDKLYDTMDALAATTGSGIEYPRAMSNLAEALNLLDATIVLVSEPDGEKIKEMVAFVDKAITEIVLASTRMEDEQSRLNSGLLEISSAAAAITNFLANE